ncbi:MAG: DUF58 domain-containing protein [Aquificae bacterium]|nr:DUF58 domain-containing protein [Aquificota bacterium]
MRVRVNKAGKLFILLTVLLGVAAVNTGNNLLYLVVSLMLASMLVSGVSSYLNLKNLRISVKPPRELYARRPARLKVFVKTAHRCPSYLVSVGANGGEALLPKVGPEAQEYELTFRPERRGLLEKVKLRVSSEFPFGFFERYYELELPVRAVVFPEPISSPGPATLLGGQAEGYASERSGFEEVKDLRPYRGEPLKLVHWKVSAKRGELTVKNAYSYEAGSVLLSLDAVEGTLEERLSKLTYLINKYFKDGFAVGLELGSRRLGPVRGEEHRLKLLRELALYEGP